MRKHHPHETMHTHPAALPDGTSPTLNRYRRCLFCYHAATSIGTIVAYAEGNNLPLYAEGLGEAGALWVPLPSHRFPVRARGYTARLDGKRNIFGGLAVFQTSLPRSNLRL
jgi:hypothetical protein